MENKDYTLEDIMETFNCDEQQAKEIAECVEVVKGNIPF